MNILTKHVESFLGAVENIRFHDGSGIESYTDIATNLLRYRATKETGEMQIGFESVPSALRWAWELEQNDE